MSYITYVGFIGLGAMGSGMAKRLLRRCRVTAYDVNPQRLQALADAGATPAASVADVVRESMPYVITSLPSPEVFAKVAEEEILPAVQRNQIIIDVGTSRTDDTQRLAAAFAERGAMLVDAPVSGGKTGAADGKLRIFVGGEQRAYEICTPLLKLIGDPERIVYFGPSGAGQIAKVVNQLAMGLGAAAYLESLAFGVRQGVDPTLLRQAIGGDDGWRKHFADIATKIAGGTGHEVGVKAGELEDFLDEAAAAEIDLPMTAALHRFCEHAAKTVMEANRLSPSYWNELMRKT